MKIIIKLILFISLALFGINSYNISYAEWETNTIEVSEKIPWANCVAYENWYKCETPRGFAWMMLVMWDLLKYFTYIAWLFSVLALVAGWVMYSMWWANESLKSSAKDYIEKSLIWLVLLLLSWVILYLVAPWVYR